MPHAMKETKKITFSAVMCALAVAIMALGALVETVDMAMAALASLTAVLVYLEIGAPYTYLTWIVSTLLVWLIFPQSLMWAEYLLIFGLYPWLKGYIERLPRLFWPLVKFIYFNAALLVLLFLIQWITGVRFIGEGADVSMLIDLPFLQSNVPVALAILGVIANISMYAYDMFLAMVARLYVAKYRKKMQRFFR